MFDFIKILSEYKQMLHSDVFLRSIECKLMVDIITKVAVVDWFITFVILDCNSDSVAQFRLHCVVLEEHFLNLFCVK